MRLTRVAAGCRAPVLAKCEFLNPGGSLKDRIALAIVDDAERSGALRPGATLVEATGGNTGVGLALVANARGYRLVCVLPEKMSHDKRRALALLGAEVIVTKDAKPDDPEHFQNVAQRLARERGWFYTEQFRNPSNAAVHRRTTALELLEQTGGRIGAFVSGAGTGGTLSGVAPVLKEACPGVRIVLADPRGSKFAHVVRTGELPPDGDDHKYALEGMGGSVVPESFDIGVVDEAITVRDEDAFAMTKRLIREEGLLAGGSSGAAAWAAVEFARRSEIEDPVVVILADSWDRYFSKGWLGD